MLAIALAAMLQGGPAMVVTQPHWLLTPTSHDMMRVYPRRAIQGDVPGRATIGCGVAATGKLIDCRVLHEFPKDYGFGEAALKLGPKFEMRPMTETGQAVGGGTVRIPLKFSTGGRIDALTSSLRCYGEVSLALAKSPGDTALTAASKLYLDLSSELIRIGSVSEAGQAEAELDTAVRGAGWGTNQREAKRWVADCTKVVEKALAPKR